jgi:hypothetical protein
MTKSNERKQQLRQGERATEDAFAEQVKFAKKQKQKEKNAEGLI